MITRYPIPAEGAEYYGRILELADEAEKLLTENLLAEGAGIREAVLTVITRHYNEVEGHAAEFGKSMVAVLMGRKARKESQTNRPEQSSPGFKSFVSRAAAARERIENEAPVIELPDRPLDIRTLTEEQLPLGL